MDAAAVQAIADLAQRAAGQETIVKADDREFSTTKLHEIPVERLPEPSTLELTSLEGLVGFVEENRDDLELEKCIVHVKGPGEVVLLSNLRGASEQRFVYARAKAVDVTKAGGFVLGKHMPVEEFIVGLQTCFVDHADRAEVLRLVGNLEDAAIKTSRDDGVSQEVTVRQKVAGVELTSIQNPVMLAPFRTFREVAQPSSAFLLRVQKGATAALFAADGGQWELEAVAYVAEHLQNHLPRPLKVIR